MVAETENRPLPSNLKREALIAAAGGLALTAIFGAMAVFWLGTAPLAVGVAALLYSLFMAAAWRWLPDHLPHDGLGTANRVTIFRAALIANFAPLAVQPQILAEAGWNLTALLLIAFALDGIDGQIARRLALASRFGARFDQELDAGFTLILAVLTFAAGKAGAWVLLAGLWHYGFRALGRLAPRYDAELPFSHRRRAICGLQIAALIFCLTPAATPQLSQFVAGGAVLLLSASFMIDITWLSRRRSPPPGG